MLKKEWRITKKKEFDLIFSKGKSRYANDLGVKLIDNNLTFNRFGVIVSNKVSKSAVERNKVRRRIRAHIYALLPDMKKGYDVIIITLPTIKQKGAGEIKAQLEQVLRALKLY